MYASSFDLGDGISVGGLIRPEQRAYEDQKMLEIIPISASQAYVRYADIGAAQKMAFSDQYAYLNPANVEKENDYTSSQHTHISTVRPGRLSLEGNKWRLTEKVGIRYDALTIEESIARTTSVSVTEKSATAAPAAEPEKAVPQLSVDTQPVVKPAAIQAVPTQSVAKSTPLTEVSANQVDINRPVADAKPLVESNADKLVAESILLTQLDGKKVKDEVLKESLYEALIPEEYLELRGYLRNDGFLSNEEINAALRDARLDKNELAQRLADKAIPTDNPALQEKLTDYLWELHEIIQNPTLEKVRADQLYQVETLQPIPDAERKIGEENQRQANQKQSDRSLEIVNGGLLANFLHNYKKTHNLAKTPNIEMASKTRYQWQDVEASLNKMGLTREILTESGNLERLLKGEKTGVIDFSSEFNGQQTALRGKIYLVSQGQTVKPYFQTVKQNLRVPDHYLGYQFSEEDKESLQQKGELGKRVELDDQYSKKKFNAYIGVDKETNSLTVWRADRVHIPMQIKGVDVSKEQQEMLREGGSIRLSGLTSENGQKFDADIQISAGKRSLSFSPPSEAIKQSIDVKTAKELNRPSEQLQGTSAGAATTKDELPGQKQKKAVAKQKGIDSTIDTGKKREVKKPGKSKKAQNDQSLSV